MKRLWILISGYNDYPGLRLLCKRVRNLWPDADRYPIVYVDGVYQDFPHSRSVSTDGSMDVARKYASFIISWSDPAPAEYLKRTPYFIGNEGDYVLILDCDEEPVINKPYEFLKNLSSTHYRVPFYNSGDGAHISDMIRLIRVHNMMHHWGAHEHVFIKREVSLSRDAPLAADLRIIHYGDTFRSSARQKAKKKYYDEPIRRVEAPFRMIMSGN